MTISRVAHWIGLLAALTPIPFVIEDWTKLRLSDASFWMQVFAVAYTLAIGALAYAVVRGLGWLVARVILMAQRLRTKLTSDRASIQSSKKAKVSPK